MGRLIFISPHLDDAVLSCGGLISNFSSKARIEIWTLFCGNPILPRSSPLVRWLHGICDVRSASELARIRKKEDERASKILGSHIVHFPFLDCVYRVKDFINPLYPHSCIGEVNPKDHKLVLKISRYLRARIQTNDIVFAPLGIGNHIDHIITKRAVESIDHSSVCYYQDVPYAITQPTTNKLIDSLHIATVMLKQIDLYRWHESFLEYKSQLKMLDPGNSVIKTYIETFASTPFHFYGRRNSLELFAH